MRQPSKREAALAVKAGRLIIRPRVPCRQAVVLRRCWKAWKMAVTKHPTPPTRVGGSGGDGCELQQQPVSPAAPTPEHDMSRNKAADHPIEDLDLPVAVVDEAPSAKVTVSQTPPRSAPTGATTSALRRQRMHAYRLELVQLDRQVEQMQTLEDTTNMPEWRRSSSSYATLAQERALKAARLLRKRHNQRRLQQAAGKGAENNVPSHASSAS